ALHDLEAAPPVGRHQAAHERQPLRRLPPPLLEPSVHRLQILPAERLDHHELHPLPPAGRASPASPDRYLRGSGRLPPRAPGHPPRRARIGSLQGRDGALEQRPPRGRPSRAAGPAAPVRHPPAGASPRGDPRATHAPRWTAAMSREITFVRAINEALREEMRRDPTVFILGEDVVTGSFGKLVGLADEFGPERVRNTPISESAFCGAAIGAAATGMRPVVEIMFASFSYVAMDQLCNQAAKLRYMTGGQLSLPIVYRTMYGVFGGAAAQHSVAPYAQFMQVLGLKIALPATPEDAKGLLKSAIRDPDPVLFFECGRLAQTRGDVPAGEHLVPLGRARIHRPGRDATVVALGFMVREALQAAELVEP